MPGQDQVLGGLNSVGLPHNVIRGAQQVLEMNHQLDSENAEGEESPQRFAMTGPTIRDQEWAQELRKADERSHEIQLRCEDLKKANQGLESRIKQLEESVEVRDGEILRLSQLYQGGQNNEKLTMQYLQQNNEKIVSKLNAQIDFINKENHRLQTQLDLFLRDKTVVDHIERYRKDVDELTFENHTLRKDLRELATTLKDY